MHIEFLLEEPSAEEALHNILPKIIQPDITYRFHTFRGKKDLLKKLPDRLHGYANWLPSDYKIVVLIDEDREDCRDLKAFLEQSAVNAGLTTKSSLGHEGFQVLNRIIVEELESWFLGDERALCSTYPRISRSFFRQRKYRDPDAILGGTWEALEYLLKRHKYFIGGYEKVRVAREVSKNMNPAENRSKSFQVFRDAMLSLF